MFRTTFKKFIVIVLVVLPGCIAIFADNRVSSKQVLDFLIESKRVNWLKWSNSSKRVFWRRALST